ncbi:hypothetical protein OBBRIDRAFT_790335 [Obba rivulosa]|uniref:Uncharacterized protein n=1 Tax=Obba rivulosa TaxID=1052685 RepID=A0A8E2J2G6_9APHY|nr:hypothetical protein OBBRIDRAFT_790335 [Obba rivulosa]
MRAENSPDSLASESASQQMNMMEKYLQYTTAIGITLRPMTAAHNTRYDTRSLAHTNWLTISQGLHTSGHKPKSGDLPIDWNMYVHPEGTVYYINTGEVIPVVTDTPVCHPTALKKLEEGVGAVWDCMNNSQTSIPNNSELYIYAEPNAEECKYYLIYHDSQTEFWLENTEMSSLYMPPVSSEAHLKFILQEHY